LLRGREADRKLVESILKEAKREYSEKAKVQALKVTLDTRVYLPPPPSPTGVDSHEPFW
jgi:V-type H+-transporting ATPase subunit E